MELRGPHQDRQTPRPANRRRLWSFLTLALGLASLVGTAGAEPLTEDEVKAGFFYNFIFFVEWPSQVEDNDDSITLCIAGERLPDIPPFRVTSSLPFRVPISHPYGCCVVIEDPPVGVLKSKRA